MSLPQHRNHKTHTEVHAICDCPSYLVKETMLATAQGQPKGSPRAGWACLGQDDLDTARRTVELYLRQLDTSHPGLILGSIAMLSTPAWQLARTPNGRKPCHSEGMLEGYSDFMDPFFGPNTLRVAKTGRSVSRLRLEVSLQQRRLACRAPKPVGKIAGNKATENHRKPLLCYIHDLPLWFTIFINHSWSNRVNHMLSNHIYHYLTTVRYQNILYLSAIHMINQNICRYSPLTMANFTMD